MGTRNLTIVKYDYQIRVAQYGQWDGYPSGNGQKILNFLRAVDFDLQNFIEKVKLCQFVPQEKLEKLTDEKWVELCQKKPQFSRDTGAGILEMIQNNKAKKFELKNELEFGFDDLFCEWMYIIDLDHKQLIVRHNFIEPFCVVYNLDRLPETMGGLEDIK